jgi:hypothetical protein
MKKSALLVARWLLVSGIALAAPVGFAQDAAPPAATPVPEVAPPVPVQPQRLEVTRDAAPVQLRQQDAELLLQRLRGQRSGKPALAESKRKAKTPSRPKPPPPDSGTTVQLPQPDVVNRTERFLYQDVTDRSQPLPPRRPLAERRDSVEAYRRSLLRERREVEQPEQ